MVMSFLLARSNSQPIERNQMNTELKTEDKKVLLDLVSRYADLGEEVIFNVCKKKGVYHVDVLCPQRDAHINAAMFAEDEINGSFDGDIDTDDDDDYDGSDWEDDDEPDWDVMDDDEDDDEEDDYEEEYEDKSFVRMPVIPEQAFHSCDLCSNPQYCVAMGKCVESAEPKVELGGEG